MGRMSRYGNALYSGRRSIDFMGQRPLWYLISVVLVGLAVAVVAVKGLNFGVEFTGGTEIRVSVADSVDQEDADELRDTIAESGVEGGENPTVTTAGSDSLVLTTEALSESAQDEVTEIILELQPSVDPQQGISVQDVGPSWGAEVAERALIGVVVFLVLVMIFVWVYFREWKMSIAGILALAHDVAVTVGIYALSGFQVTPSAVTGVLAILGFSLYDTVVVFDKIKENNTTFHVASRSYREEANLAVNQTLVRSINTSIVALIPIGAILYVSAVQLGASSLQDLALAQFVGMAAGVYSSVMLAPRFLVHLKSSETEVKEQARRARARKRALADKYASVPAFTEDMPVRDEEETPELELYEDEYDEDDDDDGDDGDRDTPRRTSGPDGAAGRGRVAPTSARPVSQSGSSGRQQPVRQPRSKRGKK